MPKEVSEYKKKYLKYLKSEKWANIRLDLFLCRGEKCELCERKNKLQIHHLTYDRIFNEEPEDLVILCSRCHRNQHPVEQIKKRIKVKPKLSLAAKVLLKKKRKKALRKKWNY